ncbi:gamma subclass chorismate mutase AroQ [Kibdelosporangium philippinense]|uniref:chorismate mutase n=1 Tax=Kibdelosporangium philippinense TaxID=211113 RepID=A0ABS8Z4B5_9PSEU|nr:gamma subclass chorismate mutase AroQ [Kibdelosporangium philippinense]MCE7002675.1 gamma subclass chorismate mutase AroQ [Kibdelosporangium philippinense]
MRLVGSFELLAELAVRRVLLGDLVAAAKYNTGTQIHDPVREQQILDAVAADSVRLGIPVEPPRRLFHAQIEASKIVQRGLFARWDRYPHERPARTPDLAREVRPQLDRLTTQIMDQLHAAVDVWPPATLSQDWRLGDIVQPLDELHRRAVTVSLRPILLP